MKDKTTKKPGPKEDEPFTKEDFLKALKKATRPVFQKASRGKEKRKTSE